MLDWFEVGEVALASICVGIGIQPWLRKKVIGKTSTQQVPVYAETSYAQTLKLVDAVHASASKEPEQWINSQNNGFIHTNGTAEVRWNEKDDVFFMVFQGADGLFPLYSHKEYPRIYETYMLVWNHYAAKCWSANDSEIAKFMQKKATAAERSLKQSPDPSEKT